VLKVLLVDDEHFILQGLKVLINWEKEGFIIAGTASDGYEALDFLKNNSNAFIIAKNSIVSTLSSTFIRDKIRNGKSVRYLTPDEVISYINNNNLYK